MNITKSSAVLLAGAFMTIGAHAPAFAASPITEWFMANAEPNVDFLDRSSRMALTNSKNTKIRAYALSEAKDATLAANTLDLWIENRASAKAAVASADTGALQTGRSVAIDGQTQPAATFVPIADARNPAQQEDLDRLFGLEGKEFDDLYKAKQIDALSQLRQDYADYVVKGDDPALKAAAVKELPKVEDRLALLSKM